mgnify:CR=1 FL=1
MLQAMPDLSDPDNPRVLLSIDGKGAKLKVPVLDYEAFTVGLLRRCLQLPDLLSRSPQSWAPGPMLTAQLRNLAEQLLTATPKAAEEDTIADASEEFHAFEEFAPRETGPGEAEDDDVV